MKTISTVVNYIIDHPGLWGICAFPVLWLLIWLIGLIISEYEYRRIKWEWRDTPKNRKRKGYNE